MATFARPRDLVVAFARALHAKDADELGELFIDDAEFVNIMGMRMRRRQALSTATAGPSPGRSADAASTSTRSTSSVSPMT